MDSRNPPPTEAQPEPSKPEAPRKPTARTCQHYSNSLMPCPVPSCVAGTTKKRIMLSNGAMQLPARRGFVNGRWQWVPA